MLKLSDHILLKHTSDSIVILKGTDYQILYKGKVSTIPEPYLKYYVMQTSKSFLSRKDVYFIIKDFN